MAPLPEALIISIELLDGLELTCVVVEGARPLLQTRDAGRVATELELGLLAAELDGKVLRRGGGDVVVG